MQFAAKPVTIQNTSFIPLREITMSTRIYWKAITIKTIFKKSCTWWRVATKTCSSSVEFGMYLRSESLQDDRTLSEVSEVLPLKKFQCLYVWLTTWRSFLVLSKKIVQHFLFLCLDISPRRSKCDVLGFVSVSSVSSSSTLQIFRRASHLRGCFALQFTYSGMSRTVYPQESLTLTNVQLNWRNSPPKTDPPWSHE